MNAKYNLVENGNVSFAVRMGRAQLTNAVTLLEKGYDLNELIDPILEKYPNVDKEQLMTAADFGIKNTLDGQGNMAVLDGLALLVVSNMNITVEEPGKSG